MMDEVVGCLPLIWKTQMEFLASTWLCGWHSGWGGWVVGGVDQQLGDPCSLLPFFHKNFKIYLREEGSLKAGGIKVTEL